MQIFEIKNKESNNTSQYEATQNACKLCTPLGACVAFKGIEGAITLLHGSQGCSTYIRRYLISHYREPIDIASSNFSEETAIYGGESNLNSAIQNVIKQYKPTVIGIPTTCLSETIGDDVGMIIKSLKSNNEIPFETKLIPVSTPSYKGTHSDGYYSAVRASVEMLAQNENKLNKKFLPLFHAMQSPADIRYLKEIIFDFDLEPSVFPDYSKTLDGGLWEFYEKIPSGGTPIKQIVKMGDAINSIELGNVQEDQSASSFLEDNFGVVKHSLNIPIGIIESDMFFDILKKISGKPIPEKYVEERNRLVDSYVDGHKYLFGKRALLYGEEELVVSLAQFLAEIGVEPAICATGSTNKTLKTKLKKALSKSTIKEMKLLDDADFVDIRECAINENIDMVIGNSKGHKIAKELNVPLIRLGFPIHDRIGAQRILHVGYRGTQNLFDKITNAVIEQKQDNSSVGYSYI